MNIDPFQRDGKVAERFRLVKVRLSFQWKFSCLALRSV
jgi:hypothetical protein